MIRHHLGHWKLRVKSQCLVATVETFNSSTSRPDVCQCLVVQHPRITYKHDNLNISMTHVDCKSEVRLVIRSFLHPYPKKWVAIGHAVVYHARSAHRFSARIKCRHCTLWIYSGTLKTATCMNEWFCNLYCWKFLS